MITRSVLVSILAGFVLMGCSKENEEAVPECIQDRLRTFEMEEACEGANLQKYQFENQRVYLFDPGYCSGADSIEVRNGECQVLGFLGGILNNTEINGLQFYAASESEGLIWQN